MNFLKIKIKTIKKGVYSYKASDKIYKLRTKQKKTKIPSEFQNKLYIKNKFIKYSLFYILQIMNSNIKSKFI